MDSERKIGIFCRIVVSCTHFKNKKIPFFTLVDYGAYLRQNSTSEFNIQVSNLSIDFLNRHRSFISNIEVFNLTSKF